MEIELACLDIYPVSLLEQYEAVLFVRQELVSGRLTGRTREAISKWLDETDSRSKAERNLALLRKFLDGQPLENAEGIFKKKYVEILSKPESWATLAWIISNKPTILTNYEILKDVIRSFLSPTQSVYFPYDLTTTLGGTTSADSP